jgi:hypothetical protein
MVAQKAFAQQLPGIWCAKWWAFGWRLVGKNPGVSQCVPANHFDTTSLCQFDDRLRRTVSL